MDPIVAPAPPASAFNKNRRTSDLLQGQIVHFQHLEHKHGLKLDPALTRDLGTEGGAARYIAEITRAIRGMGGVAPAGIALMPSSPASSGKRRPSRPRIAGLDIAASALPDTPRASGAPAAKGGGRSGEKAKKGKGKKL